MDTAFEAARPPSGSAPPRLIIDGRVATADGIGPAHRLLGLTLLERLALAARRSGFGTIAVLAHEADVPRFRGLLARIDAVELGSAANFGAGRRCVLVPGTVVGERTWLEAAARMTVPEEGSLSLGAGIVVCGERVTSARVAAMAAGDAAVGQAIPPLRLESKADLAAAERRLMRSLGKSTDGFMERNVERPLSRILSRRLAATPVTPNRMTLISALVGLSAAPFFLSAAPLWQTVGALIFLAHSILDGCDGELARLKFQESRWGGTLDFWVDNVVHAAIFGCMAVGWSLAIGAAWPLALGAAAVLGTLGSAGFVYWRVMRPKRSAGPLYVSVAREQKSRLVSMLDSLSRRDFIYLVLLLSLFGKSAWFLTLAAIGAPIFFVLLLVIAAQERGGNRLAHP
ncbi:MAG TPA: CDP-alcohol phosphatidyltransferase family protein [Alphaproteobacteria bacterium]|jgi:phosphatidylglycerophosphate synthase